MRTMRVQRVRTDDFAVACGQQRLPPPFASSSLVVALAARVLGTAGAAVPRGSEHSHVYARRYAACQNLSASTSLS